MKYKEADVEELVQAALNYIDNRESFTPTPWDNFVLAANKFRPKPPRVGYMGWNYEAVIDAIELTPEVRDALKVAGIEWEETT